VDELNLDEIWQALEGVTPGPWQTRMEIDGYRAGRETVVWAHNKRVFTVDQTRMHWDLAAEANAAFTAGAREWVPQLLAEVRRLRKLVGGQS
jgi:hypothetical protein